MNTGRIVPIATPNDCDDAARSPIRRQRTEIKVLPGKFCVPGFARSAT